MTRRRLPPPRRWPWLIPVGAIALVGGLWFGLPPESPQAPAHSFNDSVPHGRPPSPRADASSKTTAATPKSAASTSAAVKPRSSHTSATASISPTPTATTTPSAPRSSKPAWTAPPSASTAPSAMKPTTPTAPFTPRPRSATSQPSPKSTTTSGTGGVPVTGPGTTAWSTSSRAVAAASRMAAAMTVGDPACSMSAVGQPDPTLIPVGVASVETGESGGYWCLIW